jgi:FG-GAP repeat
VSIPGKAARRMQEALAGIIPVILGPLALIGLARGQVTETQSLWAPVYSGSFFGSSSATTEQWALIGAYNHTPGGYVPGQNPPGGAFIYRRTAAGWQFHQELAARDASDSWSALFGWSVDIDGTTAVISAMNEGTVALVRGAVYVYEFDGEQWIQVQKLTPPSKKRGLSFGKSVAMDGDWIAVSYPGDSTYYENNGAIILFERTPNGGWQRRHRLIPRMADGQSTPWHGMDMNGGVLAAGDVFNDLVFVFERVGREWSQTAILEDPTPWLQAWYWYGLALSVERDRILVGNPYTTDGKGGSALIFDRQATGEWVFQQEIQPDFPAFLDTDRFGVSTALWGDRVLVGAPSALDSNGVPGGQAYLFERDPISGTWNQVARLTGSRSPGFGGVGESVALTDSQAIVGVKAGIGSIPGVLTGAVYTYDLDFGTTFCEGQPNSQGTGARLRLFGSPVIEVGDLRFAADGLPPSEYATLLAGPTQAFVIGPGGSQGNLCLGAPAVRVFTQPQGTGPLGELELRINPRQASVHPALIFLPGETWSFQLQYTDSNPGPTSNFSDAVEVELR